MLTNITYIVSIYNDIFHFLNELFNLHKIYNKKYIRKFLRVYNVFPKFML